MKESWTAIHNCRTAFTVFFRDDRPRRRQKVRICPWPGCKPVIASSAASGHESCEECRLNSDREEESGLKSDAFPSKRKTKENNPI